MNKIPVSILGKVYEFEAPLGDELLVSSLADYLESKLNEIQRDTGIVDTQKLAILAALNIADELFRLKNSRETVTGTFDKKAHELIKVLDGAMTA